MRQLLQLPLEGKGARDIEALPSYLLRLSAAHGVTPGGLFLHLLNEFEGAEELSRAIAAQPIAALVRPNATTERVIDVLTHWQCKDIDQLRRATFLYLSPALARSPKAYSHRLRWCPSCLYEQWARNSTPHLKLSWFLADVRACNIHRIVLRNTCPHCERAPYPKSSWYTFSRCPHCQAPLYLTQQSDVIDFTPEAAAPDLIELVEGIVTRSSSFPMNSVNRYVDKVFNEAWASEREVVLWAKLPRDECLRYSAIDEPITLAVARRIAFRLEVPILELLDSAHPTIRSFGFASETSLPAPMWPNRKIRTIDRKNLLAKLKTILESPSAPISLPQVARRLSVSVGALRYHCPETVAMLVSRYSAFKQAEANRKRAQATEAVRAAILAGSNSGASLGKKALLRILREQTGLPKNLLRAELKVQWRS